MRWEGHSLDHRPVKGIEYYSGWEKSLDKKLARQGAQSRQCKDLLPHVARKADLRDWMPYRPATVES